ncbi:MAG: DoxX family membrane protein [Acidobacteria bacterium]|nr:DoxX family membrane protein [Acidobacteriota bacterium]
MAEVSKRTNILLWVLQALAAAVFLMAGSMKLTNPEALVKFTEAGLPLWFCYFLGAAEVAGAIGLLVPRLAGLAAACLAILMTGAVVMHLTKLGGSPLVALFLLLATVFIARMRGLFPRAQARASAASAGK